LSRALADNTVVHTRRAGITTALKTLRSSGFIEVGRGYISLLDRTGLESIAGRFYGRPEVEFERLIATPWPPEKKGLSSIKRDFDIPAVPTMASVRLARQPD
jgi:hypothetical protein